MKKKQLILRWNDEYLELSAVCVKEMTDEEASGKLKELITERLVFHKIAADPDEAEKLVKEVLDNPYGEIDGLHMTERNASISYGCYEEYWALIYSPEETAA